MRVRAVVPLVLSCLFLAVSVSANEPIANWSAPATWSPPRGSGLRTLSDATSPLPFIGLPPCRLVDTRGTLGVPINTGGGFAADEFRTWVFTGLCGLPVGAGAVSLNITVTSTGGQTGFGFVKVWPGGGTEPNVSTLNWSTAGVTESNAAIVPFGTSPAGSISLRSGNNSSQVIVDVNGYYATTPATGTNGFKVLNSGQYAIWGESTGTDARGVVGVASATGGTTQANFGVVGVANGTSNAIGVVGAAASTTGKTYGVLGGINAAVFDVAGVYGVDSTVTTAATGFNPAGVRGESTQWYGVVGTSRYIGVFGQLQNSAGALTQYGLLGANFGTAADAATPPWGVFSAGNLGATGTKHFVEPHATDASRVVLYSSLEGREVGTYFRGTARTVRGQAVIEVPEDFRMVTYEEGLTVQLTPVGPLTMMSIESEDLDRIVVRSSKDVTFHYLVQGVRRAFKDFEPVVKGFEFMPRSAEERIPAYLTEEAKRRLIANGTYNPDGTVNMNTAERLGWVKAWKDREESARAAVASRPADSVFKP